MESLVAVAVKAAAGTGTSSRATLVDGDEDALARLGAQMEAQQAQISMLLAQQAKVMEALGVISSERSQSKRDKTSRETVA
mmetsp:Transcript_94536/g.270623  ORF Transcript_94536/g.270623 Transcript_94536/m.270623 type:complete len:81 (-) Transcript_94536:118-360(-)